MRLKGSKVVLGDSHPCDIMVLSCKGISWVYVIHIMIYIFGQAVDAPLYAWRQTRSRHVAEANQIFSLKTG
jgi:hypothetical protein